MKGNKNKIVLCDHQKGNLSSFPEAFCLQTKKKKPGRSGPSDVPTLSGHMAVAGQTLTIAQPVTSHLQDSLSLRLSTRPPYEAAQHTHTHTQTWFSSLCSLQAWSSSTNLMSPAFSQGADRKLEGAARHMLPVVSHTHSVNTRLSGDKTNAVGVVLSLHDVRLVNLARRAGHLSCHVCYADL